jgi:hypothetical protein
VRFRGFLMLGNRIIQIAAVFYARVGPLSPRLASSFFASARRSSSAAIWAQHAAYPG